MAGNAEELVIRVIGDDAQYTAVMKRVQRTIEKTSGATNKFNRSSREMGEGAGNVRRQFGLLDNAIRGAHSYAMIDLIRGFEKTKLVMVALPIAATIAGIAVIGGVVGEAVQKFGEWRRESTELARAVTSFQTGMLDTNNKLKEKLLGVQAQIDRLTDNPLSAMKAELQQINMQSMDNLIGTLKQVGTELDTILKKEQTSMFLPGIGSKGAENAWSDFALNYHKLLSQQNAKGASDLLAGTLKQAETVLKLQQQSQQFSATHNSKAVQESASGLYALPYNAAYATLQQKFGIGDSEKEIESQQALVNALKTMSGAEALNSKIKHGTITLANIHEFSPLAKQGAEAVRKNIDAIAEASRNGLIMPHPLLGLYGQPDSNLRSVMPLSDLSKNSDMTAGMSEQSKFQAQWLTNLNKGAAIQEQVAVSMARVRLQIAQATGSISAHDAAIKLADIHTEEYTQQISALYTQLGNLKKLRDSGSISGNEYSARASAIENEMAQVNGQRQIQYAHDQAGIYGSTVSGATRNALSQMVQSWTDMSKQIPDLITSSLDEVNRSLASSLMAKTYIDARGSSDPASVHAAVMRAMGAYMPMMPGVAVHSIKNENSRVPSRKRI